MVAFFLKSVECYCIPVQWGAYVREVSVGGPAQQAGILANDIITRVGDHAIGESSSFLNALFYYKPGEKVAIEVKRSGSTLTLTATLREMR